MRSDRVLKNLLKEKFLVSLNDGTSIEGLLIEMDDKTLQFANCQQVVIKDSVTSRHEVDGQVFIPRSTILYLQKP